MTRIHKRIGRRIKKFAGHYTKYLVRRDTIFATIAVFIFLILLGMIPLNFYVLNPMKLALKDFDFNDVAYAKGKKGQKNPVDDRIAIVNIGHADREELAYIIEAVDAMDPAIIGLDAYFENEGDPHKDSILRYVLANTNIVGVSRLYVENDSFRVVPDAFECCVRKHGFANLNAEDVGTVRTFAPFEMVENEHYPQIAAAIVKEYDKKAYEKLEKRHKTVEVINYTRNHDQYWIIEKEKLLLGEVDTNRIKGKIVLLGYVNKDPHDVEDKKFTPMNAKFAGKKIPDMNGVVVQANIITMILDGNYIKKMPKWFAWVVAILIGWVHMSLFIRYYLENHIWFHLVAKLSQVFSVLLFAYIGILLFDQFRIKLDMKYTLYVIALAVDVIYFYEALAVWMHKKFGYHTVFHQHHHAH